MNTLLQLNYKGVTLFVDAWIDKSEPGELDEVVVDDIHIFGADESQFWLYESAGELEKITEAAANQWEEEKQMYQQQELEARNVA